MNPTKFFLLLTAVGQLATAAARAESPAGAMAAAAKNFLAALTDEQKAKATFDLKNEERMNWHFIPRARKGLPWKEMTSAQRALAHALLATAMSHRGYAKATTIMSLEQILLEVEKGSGPTRDPELYFLSLFGQPDAKGAWGWRVEGHHLSLNFTITDGQAVAVTPSFLGTNPGEVRSGPRQGLRVLGREEDLARELVKSLDAEQQKTAIYTNTAPADIITAAERKARVLSPAGLAFGKMTKPQQEQLWKVIEEYVHRYRSDLAKIDLAKIEKARTDKISFAWAGATEPGKAHYYRVQGPTFLLEYDNTQNNANHVHAVWRDLENDFGEDILRKHFEQSHAGK